jgi:hypothetical protein
MPDYARIVVFLLLASVPTISNAASGTAASSESTITVSGGGIPAAETYRLAQMYGDWFATATDAHASLTMRTLPGAHQARLGIEWDGKGLTQTIDAAKSDIHSNSKFLFSLHLTGAGAYTQDAQLRGSDAITIQITRMDNLTLEATFNGTVTSAAHTGTAKESLKITGVIKLHREATAEKPTGTFGNCDPQIHDRLAGAEWRSPSECEVKFDAYARRGLTAALQPVIDGLAAQGWKVVSSVETQSLTSIPRHTESKPFQLTEQSMHQGGAFFASLSLDPNSPIYQEYNQLAMDEMKKIITAAQAGKTVPMDAATSASRALEENTKIGIRVGINYGNAGMTNFKAGHTVKPLPGGGFTVEVPYEQPPTGGGPDGAVRILHIFLGAWSPAPTSTSTGTGENIQVKGTLDSGSANLLKVQNVSIQIQAGAAQAQQVLKLLDWNALQQLMAGK